MTKVQKFLDRLLKKPSPKDLRYDEVARFLKSIKCTVVKGKGSHRVFTHESYPNNPIVLVDDKKSVRKYQIDAIIELITLLGIVK